MRTDGLRKAWRPAALMFLTVASYVRAADEPAPEVFRAMEIPAVVIDSTLVAFPNDTPPPRERGNCFTLSHMTREELFKPDALGRPSAPAIRGWSVLNMHCENFKEAVKDWDPKTVKVIRIGDGHCLVADPRIPADWLLETPCRTCAPAAIRDDALAKHAELFRKPSP